VGIEVGKEEKGGVVEERRRERRRREGKWDSRWKSGEGRVGWGGNLAPYFPSLPLQDKVDWTITDSIKKKIETFKRTMPLIQDLKNSAMRDRHWQQLKQTIQKPFDQTSQ
jgi:hypothetical protein